MAMQFMGHVEAPTELRTLYRGLAMMTKIIISGYEPCQNYCQGCQGMAYTKVSQ